MNTCISKNEALQMALEMIEFNKHERRHVRWAIKEALCEQSSIAQSIRNAAINWPQFLGDVECEILHSFAKCDWRWYLYGGFGYEFEIQARTFMLLVAEALE